MTYLLVVSLWLGGRWLEFRSEPMSRESCHSLLVEARSGDLLHREDLLLFCDRGRR